MIMRTMKQLYILILGAGCFSACDSFLEKTPQDEMIPESTTSFNELLWGEGYPAEGRAMDVVCSYLSDEYTSLYSSGRSDEALLYQNFYTWQPLAYEIALDAEEQGGYGMTGGMNCWENYYKRVLGCNIALKYADGSIGTDEDKERLKGEALVLRAFYYFQLVNYYALPYSNKDSLTNPGVPIVLSPDIVETGSPRNTVSEVYRQILSDLNEGIRLLEMRGRESAVYRLNALSAHLLASRVYLYMENWDAALMHSRYVMERKDLVDLTGELPTLKVLENGNKEIIWMYGAKQNWYNVGGSATDSYCPSNELMKLFEQTAPAKDCRLEYYFSDITDWITGEVVGQKVDKWAAKSVTFGQAFRVAEAWLNGCEALLQKYKKTGDAQAGQEGLDLLNALRAKRIFPGDGEVLDEIPMQEADDLLKIYREERQRELCFEGQRWFDLRRFGMPEIKKIWQLNEQQNETYVLREGDPMYVLSIPSEAIDRNGKLEQNPGASEPQRMPL